MISASEARTLTEKCFDELANIERKLLNEAMIVIEKQINNTISEGHFVTTINLKEYQNIIKLIERNLIELGDKRLK